MNLTHRFLFLITFSLPLIAGAHDHWPPEFFDEERSSVYSQVDQELVQKARDDFANAQADTSRYRAIFSLVEGLYSGDWQVYNEWIFNELEGLIESKDITDQEKAIYREMYASTLGNKGVILNETGEYDEAIEMINKSLELNKELNDKKSIAYDFINLGISYSRKGDVLMSRQFYESALHEFELLEDSTGIARSLNNLGFVYDRIGDVIKSIECHERSLEIAEALGDEAGMAQSFNNLAVINLEQGNRDKAIAYYNQALEIRERLGDRRGIALVLANLGYSHKQVKEFEEANSHYLKSLEIYREVDDKAGQAFALHNLGAICMDQEDWDCADQYLSEAWEITDGIDDPHGKSSLLGLMARLDLKKGNLNAAEEKSLTALGIAQENDYLNLIRNSAKTLGIIYEQKGDWKKRYEFYTLFVEMRDSLNNSETQKATIAQSLKFEYEKAELELQKEQEIKDQISQRKLDHQRILSLVVIVFCLLFAYLAFVIWRRLKLVRQQKLVIEDQNREIKDSINYAKRIQTAILPPLRWVGENVESFVYYRPKDVVAGDFYWFVRDLPNLYFAAADCTGHGVPGAMVSVVCSNALNRAVNEYNIKEPAEILNKVREMVIGTFELSDEDVKDGMDIALCRLNKETGELVYAGAHNPLYVISRQSTEDIEENEEAEKPANRIITHNGFSLTEYKADKMPIGKHRNMAPFNQHTIKLKQGDAVYVASDGYADQFGGPKGRKFMYKPFKKLLLEIYEKPMTMQKDILNAHFEEWMGDREQVDDVCIIGLRV